MRALVCLLLAALATVPCRAEVELSLNIKGTAEEITTVLQLLKQAGLAGGAGNMEVQVESTFARPDAPPVPAPAPSTPQMGSALVAPPSVGPGKAAVLSVQVLDPDRKIDTIAAVVGENIVTGDLYDNGMNGDAAAGDGRWSLLLSMPPDLADGTYTVTFHAYDAQGAPVLLPGPDGAPAPVQATAAITVRKE